MNKFNDLSKEQFFKMLETFQLFSVKKEGIKEFVSIFEENLSCIIKLVQANPSLYNFLSPELKMNKQIIENAYTSFKKYDLYYWYVMDFYAVIKDYKNKVKRFREIFGDLSCSEDILKMLIIDEYCADKTTELLDEYKELVIADDKLLNDILCICGFIGSLSVLKDDDIFILRMVKINSDILLLASDRLKEDRYLIMEAVKNKPMVAFGLGLSGDDPILKTAIEIIKNNAHMSISLPCLDIE